MCLDYHLKPTVSVSLTSLSPYTLTFEQLHDKTNRVSGNQAKTQISLGIHPVWSESSLSAWRNLGTLATHWVHSEDSDQTGRIPRLIWVFTGRILILLVLSCRSSFTLLLFLFIKLTSQFVPTEPCTLMFLNFRTESLSSDDPGRTCLIRIYTVILSASFGCITLWQSHVVQILG